MLVHWQPGRTQDSVLPSLWKKSRLSTLPETNTAPPRKPSQKGKVVFQPIHFSSPILVSESTVTFFCAELPHRSFVIEHPHLSVPQSPPKILSGVFVGVVALVNQKMVGNLTKHTLDPDVWYGDNQGPGASYPPYQAFWRYQSRRPLAPEFLSGPIFW